MNLSVLSLHFFVCFSNDIPNKLAGDVTQGPQDIKIQPPHVVPRTPPTERAPSAACKQQNAVQPGGVQG